MARSGQLAGHRVDPSHPPAGPEGRRRTERRGPRFRRDGLRAGVICAAVPLLLFIASNSGAVMGTGFNYAPYAKSVFVRSHYISTLGCGTETFAAPSWNGSTGYGHLNTTVNTKACPGLPFQYDDEAVSTVENVDIPFTLSSGGNWALYPLLVFRWSVNTSVSEVGRCPFGPVQAGNSSEVCQVEAATYLYVSFGIVDLTNSTHFDSWAGYVGANFSGIDQSRTCTGPPHCVYSNSTIYPVQRFTGHRIIAPYITTNFTLLPSHKYVFAVGVIDQALTLYSTTTSGWTKVHATANLSLFGANYWELNDVYI